MHVMLPKTLLESFSPPTPPKVYDTPAIRVSSPRWPRLQAPAGGRAVEPSTPAPQPAPCVCSAVSRPAA